MKAVLQRVQRADVTVEGAVIGAIDRGLLVFLGVCALDDEACADYLVKKIRGLRIFPDENGKSNLSIADIGGEILIISQFTLYADTKKGNRPSFIEAAPPEQANSLYEYFIAQCRGEFSKVACGAFGASMKISLINDGPYTIILETP